MKTFSQRSVFENQIYAFMILYLFCLNFVVLSLQTLDTLSTKEVIQNEINPQARSSLVHCWFENIFNFIN
jgi:hypothetical protein